MVPRSRPAALGLADLEQPALGGRKPLIDGIFVRRGSTTVSPGPLTKVNTFTRSRMARSFATVAHLVSPAGRGITP